MAADPLTAGIELGKELLHHLWPEPLTPEKERELDLAAEAQAYQLSRADGTEFRSFVLDYEGRGKDVSPGLQLLRGSVRPVTTYLVILADLFLVLRGAPIPNTLHVLTVMVAGFWFGERALKNLGFQFSHPAPAPPERGGP